MNKSEYKHALLSEGYAESTSNAYSNAVSKVEDELDIVVYGSVREDLLTLSQDLDFDGRFEELGSRGHRTYVNAVKKYFELAYGGDVVAEVEPDNGGSYESEPVVERNSTEQYTDAKRDWIEIETKYIDKMKSMYSVDFAAWNDRGSNFDYTSFGNWLRYQCITGNRQKFQHIYDVHRVLHVAKNAASHSGVAGSDRKKRAVMMSSATEIYKLHKI